MENLVIFIFIFFWLTAAFATAVVARSRNRSFSNWLLFGILFGIPGLIYVSMFMKKDKIKYEVPHKDPAERKLWYYNLKQEFEKSKHETDISGESKI